MYEVWTTFIKFRLHECNVRYVICSEARSVHYLIDTVLRGSKRHHQQGSSWNLGLSTHNVCGPWHQRIRSGAVDIVIQLRAGESGVRVLVDPKGVVFVKHSTSLGAHPACYSMGSGVLSGSKSGRSEMFTIHLRVPKLQSAELNLCSSCMHSWCA